ncbi:kremen protein 1-like [Ostrea edulis]|uniref:kremen protein 1-like n=1 Tax=Ostrea edulis TaxID=37623 RepID=UPI0024AF6421|nr:kremen protein 1-like [Ostrea edulis]
MLKSPAHNPVPNGRRQCRVSCTKQDKYKFFGLEAGFECFCGNEMNKIYKLRPRRECNMTCVGNVQETCGGLWRIEMFSLQ